MWWGVSGALHVGLPGGLALGPTSDVVWSLLWVGNLLRHCLCEFLCSVGVPVGPTWSGGLLPLFSGTCCGTKTPNRFGRCIDSWTSCWIALWGRCKDALLTHCFWCGDCCYIKVVKHIWLWCFVPKGALGWGYPAGDIHRWIYCKACCTAWWNCEDLLWRSTHTSPQTVAQLRLKW